jgi:hypothetical protein
VSQLGEVSDAIQALLKYQEETGRSKGGENMEVVARAVSNFLQEASYSLSRRHERFP